MSRKTAEKSSSIQVKQTDDGLHLTDTILWFDSQKSGEVSFLSSATKTFRAFDQQVITTEETVKILEAIRRRPNALICQYNRPFSIGLYAPHVQSHRIPTVRQMQLKKATTLILGPMHPDPNAPPTSRKREKERLLEKVSKLYSWGEPPVVFCDPIGMAQELTQFFSEAGLPVAVHDTMFRINNVYETSGSKLGDYTRYSKYTRQKVILMPLARGSTPTRQTALPDCPLIMIESGTEDVRTQTISSKAPLERFYLSTHCDASELREIIATVSPKELYVFGPYAKRYVSEWSALCPTIKPLFSNDQPTLF